MQRKIEEARKRLIAERKRKKAETVARARAKAQGKGARSRRRTGLRRHRPRGS